MAVDILTFEKIEIDCHFRDRNGNKFIGAKIFINGEALLDRVRAIEMPYSVAKGDAKSAGDYNHQIAKNCGALALKTKHGKACGRYSCN